MCILFIDRSTCRRNQIWVVKQLGKLTNIANSSEMVLKRSRKRITHMLLAFNNQNKDH